jgi:glutamate--cysteine ligase
VNASDEPGGCRVGSVDDLLDYFRTGETPPSEWRIGTEHEKIGVYVESGKRVTYAGERGIGALLARIAEVDGWETVREGENLIALSKDGATITLEPGGQIELSGAPLRTIRETCREFNRHVELVKQISEDFGIAWLGLGLDPLHEVADIPKMPKVRYDIMRAYLPSRGRDALSMMHATATVQANFDYSDEADMVSKMRMAMACTPIVSAVFANSSLSAGRENDFISKRVEIWRHVDSERCGLLHFVFEPDFGYRRYAEWALDVPMFFVVRDHRYIPAHRTTFRHFMRDGLAGHRARLADWDLHLTTLFPEVRLKRIIEVRGADVVPRGLICALPALWKGVFYDSEARQAAWQLAGDWSPEEREAALVEVARRGLSARVAGRPVLELAGEFTDIAAEGLRRIFERAGTDVDERRFLDPVREQLVLGKSPGREVLDLWREDWRGSVERLIEYARY